MENIKLLIVGSGPAGYTAAIYAGRANLSPVLIEGLQPGGQLTTTTEVENFPGFLSVSGVELGDKLLEQAMEQGAEVELDEVVSVRDGGAVKTVICESGAEFEGRALIIAAGARPRTLGLEREEELTGSGVCFWVMTTTASSASKAR